MIYFNKLTKIPSKIRHCENPVIAEIPSLRGFEKAEAISSRIRHCEGAKRPKQSLGILEFPKIRHCEALEKPKQSYLLSLVY